MITTTEGQGALTIQPVAEIIGAEHIAELHRLEGIVAENWEAFKEAYRRAGEAIAAIRDLRLYLVTHSTWDDYLAEKWNGMSRSYAARLIHQAAVAENVTRGSLPEPSGKAALAMKGLEADEQVEVWAASVERHGGEPATEATVRAVIAERAEPVGDSPFSGGGDYYEPILKPKVLQPAPVEAQPPAPASTPDEYAGDEFYTPDTYAYSVREVLGVPELDPASCLKANRRIGAARYFTKKDDGLSLPWMARTVYLNPPYRRGLIERFVEKLILAYQVGDVGEAILLVNANTSSSWFKALWPHTLCFVDKRIRFDGVGDEGAEDEDTDAEASAHGARAASVFVYLGTNPEKFARVFAKHGEIVTRYHPDPVPEEAD